MKNKKGSIFGVGFAIFIVIILAAIVFLVSFLVSSKLRWILIGIAVLVGFVIILSSAMKSKEPFGKGKIIVLLIFLGIGLFFILGGDVLQSVLTPPTTINVENGEVFWLMTNSVNNIDEGWTFNYRVGDNVNDYELSDGSIVKPQQSMSVSFSKQDSYCYYTMEQITHNYKILGIFNREFKYWIFNNPNRVADVKITTSDGKSTVLDGTQVASTTLYDSDGNGAVTVQSQGLLVSNVDCPSNTNMAIYVNKDGFPDHVYKNQLQDELSEDRLIESTNWLLNEIYNNVNINTQFLNAFTGYSSSPLQSEFTGNINLGSSVITLTADQDYFDSIVYIPPKEVDPRIDGITCADLKVGDSGGINVKLLNREDSEGYVLVTADGTNAVVTPTSRSVLLDNTAETSFTVTAGSTEGIGKIEVKVCSQDQFYSPNCDTDSCLFDITQDEPPTICGDGICQANEGPTTCPEDCTVLCGNGVCDIGETTITCPQDCKLECEWYQDSVPAGKDYGIFGWRHILNNPIETEAFCKTAGWVYAVIGGLVIVVLGTIFILVSKKPKKGGKRKRK